MAISAKRKLVIAALAASILAGVFGTIAQAPGKKSPAPTEEEAATLLKILEDSGHLEKAFDRLLERKRIELAKDKSKSDRAASMAFLRAAQSARPVDDADVRIGPAGTRHELILYMDPESSVSAEAFRILKGAAEEGTVPALIAFRPVPSPASGRAAIAETKAIMCAVRMGGPAPGVAMADRIFKSTRASGGGISSDPLKEKEALSAIGAESGLKDRAAFERCLADSSEKEISAIRAEFAALKPARMPWLLARDKETGEVLVLHSPKPSEINAVVKKWMAGEIPVKAILDTADLPMEEAAKKVDEFIRSRKN